MELKKYSNGYILKNKKLELWMNKLGRADKLLYNGKNLIDHLDGNVVDPDRHHSFYLDYHQDLMSKHPIYTGVKVLENKENQKHLVWTDDTSDLNLEYHIIMNSEESKIYSYVVAKNKTDRTYKINEMRTVYRLDPNIFPYSKTSSRQGRQPSSNYTNRFKKWQDETYEMPDGERFSNSKVYSKYDYADYFRENDFWGFFGSELGFWFIPVSKEYYPSGPLKQELMVHYDGILLNYLNGAHFGTGDFTIKPGWQKIYGPWCIYINDGSNYNELFSDAEQKAKSEENNWPYEWIKESLYEYKRLSVEGKIISPNNYKMTVVLSQNNENFSKSSGGYIYYTDTDENGNFALHNVRPGKYKLTAFFCEGDIPGEFIKKNIEISLSTDSNKVELSNIKFDNLKENNVVWQIGTSSHTTEPFKYYNCLRNSLWRKLVPANIHYYIGESNDKEDWFAIQSNKGKWNIHFELPNHIGQDKYVLLVALAGASKTIADHENDRGHGDPQIDVLLNGTQLIRKTLLDDNAVYRNALKNGSYHLIEVTLPNELLSDKNVISFKTNGYLMYDTVILKKERTDK